MKTFKELGLDRKLLERIGKIGLVIPTEIQEKSIPYIIKGKDIVGESATGSGKTLVFGCGIIEKVRHGNGVQALVLTPTRELAEQIKNSLIELSYKRLNILAIYGGVSINPQIRYLPQTDVVIATPGRLLDHINRRTIDMSKIKIIVLDEADRMLDMGFIFDVQKILRTCPKKRQTMFFSATISPRIRGLVNNFMTQPKMVYVDNQVDPSKLKHVYYDVEDTKRLSLLAQLLENEYSKLVLVFCNTRRDTDFVAKNLRKNGIEAIPIHGGLSQNQRTKTIEFFNKSKTAVLVCTDVASRGLHIDNVSHVYNYDLPDDPKDYVHRIGRTARAGEEGLVVNILAKPDHFNFSAILRNYPDFSIIRMKLPKLEKIIFAKPRRERVSRRGPPRKQRFSRRRGPRTHGFSQRSGSRQWDPRKKSKKTYSKKKKRKRDRKTIGRGSYVRRRR